jgi:hypothetical protein
MFLLGVVMLISPPRLPGQIENGEIVGIVTDPSGAVLVNASVRVQNMETGQETTLRTNSSGLYTGKQLPLGGYQVTAAAAGFASVTGVVRVTAGTTLRTDFQLPVAHRKEKVETRSTGAAPIR